MLNGNYYVGKSEKVFFFISKIARKEFDLCGLILNGIIIKFFEFLILIRAVIFFPFNFSRFFLHALTGFVAKGLY